MTTSDQEIWIQKWEILPLKSVFDWKRKQEMLSSDLYKKLQRVLSPVEDFYHGNKTLFVKNNPKKNKEIFDLFLSYLSVDPNKVPPKFLELFELDPEDLQLREKIIALFQRARFLERETARTLFIDDKILIFRNEEQLVHPTANKKLTQAEKKAYTIQTTFNTYDNLYSAVRSQTYTLRGGEEKKEEYKSLQTSILTLAQSIKALGYELKNNWIFERKLKESIETIQWARNAKVLAAQLYNLEQLAFDHKILDSNHLYGAKNKLFKRFKSLQEQITIIERQQLLLEEILAQHELAIDTILAQSSLKNMDASLLWSNYTKLYQEIDGKFRNIAPFAQFYHYIEKAKHHKPYLLDTLWAIKDTYQQYQQEHQEKLNIKK